MTRINVGIKPADLCDQHLVAEYKEIYRLFSTRAPVKPPQHFKLGRGHVLWCAQHLGSALKRLRLLRDEMKYRGFKVNLPMLRQKKSDPRYQSHWTRKDEAEACIVLVFRICTRLAKMKRKPKWTKRKKPAWVDGITNTYTL